MKNLKSSGNIALRLVAWLLIGGTFIMLINLSQRMTWAEALLSGLVAGAISGSLIRLVNEVENGDQ